MKEYLSLINTATPGPRCDVTPLFADPVGLSMLIDDLLAPFMPDEIDFVAGIDALGFVLGTAMAIRLNRGFIPIRKGGKLPVAVTAIEFVDYSGRKQVLELRCGSIAPGDRVLVVDEWIETGAQVQAAIGLVESERGIVAGFASINVDDSPIVTRLRERYRCSAVWYDMRSHGT